MTALLIAALVIAVVVALVARSRGRSWWLWLLLGLLCWPIALTYVLVTPPRRKTPRPLQRRWVERGLQGEDAPEWPRSERAMPPPDSRQ